MLFSRTSMVLHGFSGASFLLFELNKSKCIVQL